MLHFRKFFTSSFKQFNFKGASSFSTTSYNPYYILGVEKTMTFDEIKKHYYKLAAEYHPDINKAPDAAKQFVIIKEAFETIKKWHGKSVKMDFEGGSRAARSDFTSVRPNAGQYRDDFDRDEYENQDKDYKEWAYKASQSAEHEQFADSFETIHDIRDIKFRPSDVEVPDASKRFGLDKNKGKILKQFADSSGYYVIWVVGAFIVIFAYLNKTENRIIDEQLDNTLYNLQNKDEYRELSLDDKENMTKQITMNMRAHKEYAKFTGLLEGGKAYEKTIRTKFVPDAQPFITMKSD